MKQHLTKIGLVFTACLLANLASQALAQTKNLIQATAATNYNTIEWSQISSNELTAIVKSADPSQIPANAWGIILKRVDWFQLPTNVQNYVSDNVDWSLVPTNILEFYNQPGEWSDSPQKQATLKRCADILRSSIDTNWLALIASKLTNQPAIFQFTNRLNDGTETVTLVTNTDIILYFEYFSKLLMSTLDEYAGYLTNPKLKTYLGAGYEGEIPSPRKNEGMIYFGFRSKEGLITDFRRLAVVRGERAALQVGFYPNGKLSQFRVFTLEHKDTALFLENGQLQHFDWIINDKISIHIDLDASGNPHVKLITLGKHPPLKIQ